MYVWGLTVGTGEKEMDSSCAGRAMAELVLRSLMMYLRPSQLASEKGAKSILRDGRIYSPRVVPPFALRSSLLG